MFPLTHIYALLHQASSKRYCPAASSSSTTLDLLQLIYYPYNPVSDSEVGHGSFSTNIYQDHDYRRRGAFSLWLQSRSRLRADAGAEDSAHDRNAQHLSILLCELRRNHLHAW